MVDKIGKWIIIGEAGQSKDGHTLYKAQCSKCGYVRITKLWNIERSASNESCTHPTGISWPSTRLSSIYRKMIQRCHNTKNKDYRFYGARGVFVCDEWRNNKRSFISWAVNNGYDDTMSIDRIDPSKGYCPENCRWIPMSDNAKYKSTTRILVIDGTTDSLSGWANRLNIPKTTLIAAVKNKTDEEAIEYIKNHSGIVQ